MLDNTMVNTLKHVELKGGHTLGNKIIISACELFENEYEVMALYENGDEIECRRAATADEAIKIFDDMFQMYAEPLQKAIYSANLVPGKKYTLVYLSEFGFPVCYKVTFNSLECTTYAQYSDCVKMCFTPYRKRTMLKKYFYNCSVMIFEGWQDLKEEDTKELIHENAASKTYRSKYACFDSRYFDDIEHILKKPVVIYKNYEKGVNGKIYA